MPKAWKKVRLCGPLVQAISCCLFLTGSLLLSPYLLATGHVQWQKMTHFSFFALYLTTVSVHAASITKEKPVNLEVRVLQEQQALLEQHSHLLSIKVDQLADSFESIEDILLGHLSGSAAGMNGPRRKLQPDTPPPESFSGASLSSVTRGRKNKKAMSNQLSQITNDMNSLSARVSKLELSVAALVNSLNALASQVDGGLSPPVAAAPSPSPTAMSNVEGIPTVSPGSGNVFANSNAQCGCSTCDSAAWNEQAPAGAGPDFTCGSRINYMMNTGMTQLSACSFVAGQFPDVCAACDPARCDNSTVTAAGTGGTPMLTPETSLYCFPPYNQRTTYNNVWGMYTVQVKEGNPCGPGNNNFATSTVSLSGNDLTLQYANIGGAWTSSEVRIVLPDAQMPYSYGTFSFSVKSVQVLDSNNNVVNTTLPPDMVLGFFTWDDLENYAVHENYNHEVDIEISRWGDANNPTGDAQFLAQPANPGPNWVRFFTGVGETYSEGGHSYSFTWEPTSITWNTDAAGGYSYQYTTAMAQMAGQPDYIQCLPAAVEVRINLWNFNGAVQPMGMSADERVEVVIDSFNFTPATSQFAADGSVCSKNCQCSSASACAGGVCTLL